MAETVNVASSPGANYTWANGKFAWSSATAGKNWTSAYPAVYTMNVATDLSFSELSQKLGIKQTFETFGFAEKQGKSMVMNKFEVMNFVETYTDLIAFVLRFVESLGITEVNSPVFALRPIFMIDFLSAIGIKSRANMKLDQIVANFAGWRSVLRSVPTRPGDGSGHRAEVAASAFCCLELFYLKVYKKTIFDSMLRCLTDGD